MKEKYYQICLSDVDEQIAKQIGWEADEIIGNAIIEYRNLMIGVLTELQKRSKKNENFERYKDEIMQLCKEDKILAFDKVNHKVTYCTDVECDNCKFAGQCSVNRTAWLYDECEEKQLQITEADRIILENLYPEYEWIAKEKNGEVWAYKKKPEKLDVIYYHVAPDDQYFLKFNDLLKSLSFDDGPVRIKDLLQNSNVDKEIPKKVLYEKAPKPSHAYMYSCPSCGTMQSVNCKSFFKYCNECGQALDWSVEDGK